MRISALLSAGLTVLTFTAFAFGQEKKVKVTLHDVTGYGDHKPFAYKAAQILEDVFNSEEFKEEVLKGKFNATKGLTNQQLYDKIMTAQEEAGPGGQSGVVDLRARTLRLDSDESGWKKPCEGTTFGVDGAGTGVTAICPQRLVEWSKKDDTAALAAHYAHEYMHMLGFNHKKFLATSGWTKKTFVYQIGDIVENLASKTDKSR